LIRLFMVLEERVRPLERFIFRPMIPKIIPEISIDPSDPPFNEPIVQVL